MIPMAGGRVQRSFVWALAAACFVRRFSETMGVAVVAPGSKV